MARRAGGDDDDESKENWDEMLDNSFDFSQDIEFGDGTAVRINSRARSKLPPSSMPPTPTAKVTVVELPTPLSAAEVGPAQPSNGAIQDSLSPTKDTSSAIEPPTATAPELPATNAAPVAAELPPTTPRAIESSWGKPAKPTAGATAEDAAAPASSRWWKASLSNNSTARPLQQPVQAQAVGSRNSANPNATPAPGRGNMPTRVEASDGNSSSNSGPAQRGGRGERGPRPGRGSRRNMAPIPTVVPPVLLRRPTQPPTAALGELRLAPELTSTATIVEPPVVEEPKLKGSTGDNVIPAPPAKAAAVAQKQQQQTQPVAQAEPGLNVPRNAKKATDPGSRKANGANNNTAEPSRLAENWRTGTAPKPPVFQPTASARVTTPVTAGDGSVEAARVPANAGRRRSTGAAKASGSGPLAPGPRPVPQQEKPDRTTTTNVKHSAAATATSWRAGPKPAAEASSSTPTSDDALGVIGAGRQRAQTHGAAGSSRTTVPGAYSGSSQSQMNGLVHVTPSTSLVTSPPLLPQTMLADILDEHEGSSHGQQSVCSPVKPQASTRGSSGGAPVPTTQAAGKNEAPAISRQQQSRLGYSVVPVMSNSSSSLFNVEGSPLMGSNSSYTVPVRPSFGHIDPGLFTWQGSHMGFHDARARQEYPLPGHSASEANSASREQPARWSNTSGTIGELPQGGVGSAVTFSSFSAGAGMLWMDPTHVAYDAEGRSFPAPMDSRASSHGDGANTSGSVSGSSTGGPNGFRAPGRALRPIGTRNVTGNNTQRNTRSRQGGANQPYVQGAPSPVPQSGQHPLFVPASHMHQSWLPHYSLMQPPTYGSAASGGRFGRASPHHSPQMTETSGSTGPPGVVPFMVPLTHSMDHQSMMASMPAQTSGKAGAFANMPQAQYVSEAFRPSPPPPPMYQYGYMSGPSTKPGKAGQSPVTTMAPAPHYHHGYPPQLPMPLSSHTGAPPHMAFMPMYIPGDHSAMGGNGNPAYYYGQQPQFSSAPPQGQPSYRQPQAPQLAGYPSAMQMADAQQGYPEQQTAATKQAEKLLGISRSSSTSTRERGGPSKGHNALPEPQQANTTDTAALPRTGSASKTHGSAPQARTGGDRNKNRGSGRRSERKPAPKTNDTGEASAKPRDRPPQKQRTDAKRTQQPGPKTDKARNKPPRPSNANAPVEAKAEGSGEKPPRRNRPGRGGGGGKKNTAIP
ncbi:hypothetical protein IWW39_004013 [Coemansia spiralis]|uniref:Uncharacterized protein n=1 Tax=Coemansia spiralis TaxID=417178 RepID=A0A9W8L420_9FUNG|nr:hypothetical protein IWW39_004013 [Coemansia spiralis]